MDLLKMLKIYANNIQVLHRNLIGSNWNSNHERLQKYYEKVQECLDSMVEILMSLGYIEPTLKESLEYVEELEVVNRSAEESFKIVQSYFQNIIAEMNRMINIPNDVISKMEEYQVWFRLEANYKLKQELGD
jgi:DNA-binding ferritin-like protein